MIENAEAVYQRIADAIQPLITEPWTSAKFEAIFYPNTSMYFGEYTRATDGAPRSLEGDTFDAERAVRELRRSFGEAKKPLWGWFRFQLNVDGTFNAHFGYDSCDQNGNALYDKDAEAKRQHDRFIRLTSPPASW